MTNAVARVYVNKIEVGTLPADVYNKIVKDVRADRRLYLGQAWNYICVAYAFLARSILQVPVFWFVALLMCEVLGPSNVTDFITAMRQATPAEVNHAICWMLGAGSLVSMIVVAFCMYLGAYPSGVVDEFDRKINHQVRSLLEVPAQGDMMVVVADDGNNGQ
ncbi:hypothetical protein [Paraburkholderia sp. GAS32]|uniref:hypothetical protein n=1 Tax=Paraburkholderia sp. GAS32 TaxID=3035129 RepID=UPI003D1960E1